VILCIHEHVYRISDRPIVPFKPSINMSSPKIAHHVRKGSRKGDAMESSECLYVQEGIRACKDHESERYSSAAGLV
jgi:hypothetical protein